MVAVLVETAPGLAGRTIDPDLEQVMGRAKLGGHYELERPLGAGGMGVVVEARHQWLRHRVAIKVLRPSLRSSAGTEQRFLIEAKAGARLKSAHVARVLDGGTDIDGLPFLVMERLEGADAERHLSTHGLPSIADTLDVIVQVLSALAEAHAAGLVHRDLKPANLFLSRPRAGRLQVKVLDFGLAKVLGDDLGLTSSTGFLGSPLYIAPEQLRKSSDVDARADVWGVGCLLYRFLTGRVPFPAESVAEVVTRIQRDDPTPVKALRPDVPEALSVLVGQLLEKNPLARPASVAEVALRLKPLVTGPAVFELEQLIGVASPAVAPVPLVTRSSSTWLVAAAASIVGALGGGLATRAVTKVEARVPASVASTTEPSSREAPVEPRAVEPRDRGRATEKDTAPIADVRPIPTPARVVAKPRAATGRDGGAFSEAFEGRE